MPSKRLTLTLSYPQHRKDLTRATSWITPQEMPRARAQDPAGFVRGSLLTLVPQQPTATVRPANFGVLAIRCALRRADPRSATRRDERAKPFALARSRALADLRSLRTADLEGTTLTFHRDAVTTIRAVLRSGAIGVSRRDADGRVRDRVTEATPVTILRGSTLGVRAGNALVVLEGARPASPTDLGLRAMLRFRRSAGERSLRGLDSFRAPRLHLAVGRSHGSARPLRRARGTDLAARGRHR